MAEKTTTLPASQADAQVEDFKGYTLEELKFQRAMFALRKELCKEKLVASLDALRPRKKDNDTSSSIGSKFALAKNLGSKFFGSLNTLDYVMLGMSIFGTAKKAFRLFKRK